MFHRKLTFPVLSSKESAKQMSSESLTMAWVDYSESANSLKSQNWPNKALHPTASSYRAKFFSR
ncbi:hypothetical protein [Rubritalea tangerina]|uniref:hypothetical protein n=1 Tax=Rubritalea tangerina TaxID=430798 RepID=UPI00361B7C29